MRAAVNADRMEVFGIISVEAVLVTGLYILWHTTVKMESCFMMPCFVAKLALRNYYAFWHTGG